jgi:hypothetical protein
MAGCATTPNTQKSESAQEENKSNIATRITHLRAVQIHELRHEWACEFRKPPPADFSRDLLVRTLVWRIQEQTLGGHDKQAVKILNGCAKGRTDICIFRRLKSGTVLVREYGGARHTVTVTRDGFIWQEKLYDNLSVIAGSITGTKWNGPRFFGLRERSRASVWQSEAAG